MSTRTLHPAIQLFLLLQVKEATQFLMFTASVVHWFRMCSMELSTMTDYILLRLTAPRSPREFILPALRSMEKYRLLKSSSSSKAKSGLLKEEQICSSFFLQQFSVAKYFYF